MSNFLYLFNYFSGLATQASSYDYLRIRLKNRNYATVNSCQKGFSLQFRVYIKSPVLIQILISYAFTQEQTISSSSALSVRSNPLPPPVACDVLPFGIVVERFSIRDFAA
ncbi:hypothetical protein CIT14_06925 [Virgibacillus profundi]|nr:hypothetical protein CIT14_06925 [Virgibacillus profundi]